METSYKPGFNKKKAINAILFIASHLTRKDFHKIFKILYFAEMDHLSKYGRMITGDSFYALQDGPVPSSIYNIFKSVRGDEEIILVDEDFSKYFTVSADKFINPISDYNLKCLSKSDLNCIVDSINKYGKMSFSELRRLSHGHAYTQTPAKGHITIESILEETGADQEYIQYVTENHIFVNALY